MNLPFKLQPVFYVIGIFVSAIGVLMLIPGLIDYLHGHTDWHVFVVSSFVTVFIGIVLILANQTQSIQLNNRQTFLLTTTSWVAASVFAALPFIFSTVALSPIDGFFEAMSGLTTTGATVITNLSYASDGIIFWRAMLHAIGGVGIVVMAVLVLPFLRIGGFQLFKSESSDNSEKLFPRMGQVAGAILTIYFAFITICAFALWWAGMTSFDAIIHSMATISTGGFSSKDASIAYFQNPGIEWILTFGMMASGLPLLYYVRLIHGQGKSFIKTLSDDSQVTTFIGTLFVFIIIMTIWLRVGQHFPIADAIRLAAFNVVSIVTTTGFVSADYGAWGHFAVISFFFLSFVGGCTGSTSGSVKIFRWQILYNMVFEQTKKMLQPHRIVTVSHNHKPVGEDIMFSVANFLFLYLATFVILSLMMGMLGLDYITAVSAVASCITNVGPGIGDVVGPTGNFATLPDMAKFLLSIAMLFGRLELLTVFVILTPTFWKK